jgi:signal transduction histidine kinase
VVEPILTNDVVSGDEDSIRAIDLAVRRGVLDRDLVRIKVWTREGKIVYSDEARLIGTTYQLGASEMSVLDSELIEAEVSDLTRPENRFEGEWNKLLEVYLAVQQPNGERLLFEAYFRYETVTSNGARVWRVFAPISLGALVAVELVQIPLAWSLARRLRQRHQESEALLRSALDASDVERRRIAADLHDGVVQDLAGVALVLGGAARQPDLPANAVVILDDSAADVRESIRSLRSLLVEIYPPNLFDEGLELALTDLVARASGRGIAIALDATTPAPLPQAVTALVYRAAQEGLRNIASHSQATAASVTVRTDTQNATLEVRDNGIGFDPAVVGRAAKSGHFGLYALTRLITDAGGTLELDSVPGGGTLLRVEVPLQ